MNTADAILTLYHSLPSAEQERVKDYLGTRKTSKQEISQKRRQRVNELAVSLLKSKNQCK